MSPLDSKPDDGQVRSREANIYLAMASLSCLTVMIVGVSCVHSAYALDEKLKSPQTSPMPSDATSSVRCDYQVAVVLSVSGPQNNILEISLGSDDGLRVGHSVEVFREGKYLGRAQITLTTLERSVATVDTKQITGPIQKGDRVTTRLKT